MTLQGWASAVRARLWFARDRYWQWLAWRAPPRLALFVFVRVFGQVMDQVGDGCLDAYDRVYRAWQAEHPSARERADR
jgi:hypothetical protein